MPKRTANISGKQITLDVRPDRLDLRDLPFRPQAVSLPPQFPGDGEIAKYLSAYMQAGLILDQGREGACTGYGLAATVNYLLWVRSRMKMQATERVSPCMLYHLARFYDEWPGENYDGSSCRGALKGWHKHGVCSAELWPSEKLNDGSLTPAKEGWDIDAVKRPLGVYYRIDRQSVVDLQAAILQSGAIYVSGSVHKGWALPASSLPSVLTLKDLPVIKRDNRILGGHAFALVGYNDIGFVVQNSWDTDWGASGFAALPYEDWVDNGTDAWVVGLGVPIKQEVQGKLKGEVLTSPKHFIRTPDNMGPRAGLPGWLGGNEPQANRTDIWSEGEAYPHTVVAGNDGILINRIVQMPSASAAAQYVCRELPHRCFADRSDIKPRIVIYAHGGLNGEEESITRIRSMGPYFMDNDIYPVFVTWKSGWAETLVNMLEDESQKELGAAAPARGIGRVLNEAWDRAIEVIARGLIARSMWTEMKENAQSGHEDGHSLSVIAAHLTDLYAEMNGNLEIHLVGHSAGAYVCGRLLTQLSQHKKTLDSKFPKISVKSCTLYAPACDLQFALDHYGAAHANNMLARDDLHLHILSDTRELDDTVGPYTKSLLYLISRSLDRLHKTPLLGMANAHDPARAKPEYWHSELLETVKNWQKFFWGDNPSEGFARNGGTGLGKNLFVYDAKQVNAGPVKIKATHGSFDNSITVLEHTLRTILGLEPNANLKREVKNLHY